jgi:glycosyltransferase involved in cell wall biosynthesis
MVSVIIPFYNHHEALQKSLQTLALQTEKDIELIIVDDGSSEPLTKEEVEKVYARPFVLITQKNSGAPAARNAGFQVSHGEYVIFWDADLLAKPMMLQTMKQALIDNRDVSFVYGDHYFGRTLMKGKPWSLRELEEQNYIHSSNLIRRPAVISWDESLKRFQDWDFYLMLGENGNKGLYLQEVFCDVIPRKGGISTWLPSFAYKKPFRYLPWWKKQVEAYEQARNIVIQKHVSLRKVMYDHA